MDRRQLKTRKAIFTAFRTLLMKKRYENITVQEIIDEAERFMVRLPLENPNKR